MGTLSAGVLQKANKSANNVVPEHKILSCIMQMLGELPVFIEVAPSLMWVSHS